MLELPLRYKRRTVVYLHCSVLQLLLFKHVFNSTTSVVATDWQLLFSSPPSTAISRPVLKWKMDLKEKKNLILLKMGAFILQSSTIPITQEGFADGQFYTDRFLFQGHMRALLTFHCAIYQCSLKSHSSP